MSNVYLHKLDEFVERELIPKYTRGASRRRNPEYMGEKIRLKKARRHKDRAEARAIKRQMRELPSYDPMDPGYRRLSYCRYADDHLLGFIGPKAEAEEIKARLAEFLREILGLELNDRKTLITHARTQRARFLGYDILVQHSDTKITRSPRSPSSGGPDQDSQRGRPSWQGSTARRSSSAARAMTTSTRPPPRARHESQESPVPGKRPAGFGGRLPGKGPHSGTSPGRPPYSGCGAVKAKLPLSERTYACTSCGMVADRDVNAARDLAALGRRELAGSGPDSNGRGAGRKTAPGSQAAVKRQPGPANAGKTGTVPRQRGTAKVSTHAH